MMLMWETCRFAHVSKLFASSIWRWFQLIHYCHNFWICIPSFPVPSLSFPSLLNLHGEQLFLMPFFSASLLTCWQSIVSLFGFLAHPLSIPSPNFGYCTLRLRSPSSCSCAPSSSSFPPVDATHHYALQFPLPHVFSLLPHFSPPLPLLLVLFPRS